MKKGLLKILSAILIMCLSTTAMFSVSASTTPENEIMPCYNNTASSLTAMNINDSGKLTITYRYTGFSSITTKAVITTYVEKRTLGLFWTRVDIGQPDDEWVDTIYDYRYTGSRTYQLSSSGTYRVTVVYKIYGSGGSADTIEYQEKDSY